MAHTRVPGSHVHRLGNRLVVSRLQHGWLDAMGVDVPWIVQEDKTPARKDAASILASSVPSDAQASSRPSRPKAVDNPPMGDTADRAVAQPVAPKPSTVALQTLDLAGLAQAIGSCQQCPLCQTRQHAVPGQGVKKPTILIVGEAPGEQEDRQGKPFVGRSGQLLDNMMKAIGQGRDTSVFITNVVKCRPPANRNPREDEIAACAPYLARQIELLAPQAILAMGRFAAHALLNTTAPLQQLRQNTHSMQVAGHAVPVVVTYHPAYLLRRPVDKRLAWEDLKQIKALVSGR